MNDEYMNNENMTVAIGSMGRNSCLLRSRGRGSTRLASSGELIQCCADCERWYF